MWAGLCVRHSLAQSSFCFCVFVHMHVPGRRQVLWECVENDSHVTVSADVCDPAYEPLNLEEECISQPCPVLWVTHTHTHLMSYSSAHVHTTMHTYNVLVPHGALLWGKALSLTHIPAISQSPVTLNHNDSLCCGFGFIYCSKYH